MTIVLNSIVNGAEYRTITKVNLQKDTYIGLVWYAVQQMPPLEHHIILILQARKGTLKHPNRT